MKYFTNLCLVNTESKPFLCSSSTKMKDQWMIFNLVLFCSSFFYSLQVYCANLRPWGPCILENYNHSLTNYSVCIRLCILYLATVFFSSGNLYNFFKLRYYLVMNSWWSSMIMKFDYYHWYCYQKAGANMELQAMGRGGGGGGVGSHILPTKNVHLAQYKHCVKGRQYALTNHTKLSHK